MKISVRVLKNRPLFRNFLAANGISLLGNHVFDITMPLWVWDKTHSPIALSLVSIALQLPYFVMAPITGYMVDNYDNRKLMIATDLSQMALLGLLLISDVTSMTSLWPILIAIFACKTLAIMFETVSTFHLVPTLVKGEDLSEANSWFFSTLRLMEIMGPLIGGLLVTAFGFRASILINILSFTATLFFVFRMKELSALLRHEHSLSGSSRRPSLYKVASNFGRSVKFVWKSPVFRSLVIMMFFWNLSSLTPTSTTVTYFFNGAHHFSPADYGAVMSIFGLFSIVGFVASSSIYRQMSFSKALSLAVVWQASFGTLAVVFSSFPLLFVLFLSIARAGSAVMAMGTFLVRQTDVPRHQSGSVNSALRMLFMSSAPISSGVQGNLIHSFGYLSSLLFGTVALWLTAYFGRKTAAAFSEAPAPERAAA